MLLSVPPGRMWRMKRQHIDKTGLYTLSALIYAVFVFIIGALMLSTVGQPLDPRSIVITLIMAPVFGTALLTMTAGIAVTAVHPPLRPVSEISVLGQRAVAFARFGLATGALFSAAILTWLVATSFDDYYFNHSLTTPEPTIELLGILGVVLGMAAWIYCMWLSVDLFRIGQARRLRCVDVVVHKIPQRDTLWVKACRSVAKTVLQSSLLIVLAFYLTPLFFLIFAAAAGV